MNTIPDAAVEAAARNMFHLRATEPDQSVPCRDTDWDSLPDSWQEEWRDGARAALAAAAPLIAEVTEAAVRERVARDIGAQLDRIHWWSAEEQVAYETAAKIARGGAA